ncbi:hypothetical protein PSTG_06669 [Puccinia striiformis f. sp. tritici PST-78]|uniref:DUF659 domain-containing protein n=1 Tax=Puccinia striiformis f. sp. tritici PST-78 TaxID=1165861 RepID=A0A0L0VM26_9BASI|nr:hypothetical protein PSTG_06669 [Puccinia striiformis f. sp. tritici PST-78]
MARHPQKRIRNQLPPEDNTEHNDQPTVDSNNEPEDEESTSSSAAPMGPDSTDEQRLGNATYASYELPILSNQLDKFIAWKCKICLKHTNQPAYDLSCSNLLSHVARCGAKHQKASGHKSLASLGISGTGIAVMRCMEKLCEDLKMHERALYLGVDAWQSPNGFDIVGASQRSSHNRVSKAKLEAMLLDFVQLKERHTGEYLARMVEYIVEKFGIENQICGIVSDNAANNGTMIAELEKLDWKRFKGKPQWIRCFAHVLNLIVKVDLRPFARYKTTAAGAAELDDSDDDNKEGDLIERFHEEDKNSDLDDDEEENGDVQGTADAELAKDDELTVADLEDLEDEAEADAYTSDLCRRSLAKFRRIATKLQKSLNSKKRFIEICVESQCKKPHNIERDVPTRWNSTYLQLSSIVRCKDARDKQFGGPHNNHVQQEDFDLAANLVQVLQPFYKLTLQLSTKGSARVAEVVVMIDQITAGLSAVIANEEERYPPALQNACHAGLHITNKYYSLTDCSPIYQIAMVLHPSFTDEYFKLAKWPKEWIEEAIDLTGEMFNK